MTDRQPPLENEQPETNGLQIRCADQKPISAVLLDALALSRVARAETSHSVVTNLTFQTGGSVTVHLKNGELYVTMRQCATSMLDSTDGATAILMLTPRPVVQ
jgi:hypothetical protein